jgi:transcriptional regulator EpsA
MHMVHAAPSAERSALHLSDQHAEAVVRLVEAVPSVLRRHHFFLWSQGQLHTLLPHRVLVCGAWAPQQRSLIFEAFHSVVLPATALHSLTNGGSALMHTLAAAWVAGRGRPLVLGPEQVQGEPQAQMQRLLQAAGGGRLLVHGVARPQRPGEIESLFVFVGDDGPGAEAQRLQHVEMLVPYLHSTWRRVQMAEIEFAAGSVEGEIAAQARHAGGGASRALTAREREILACARHGQSNLQIGEALGISPLTVKNHIQKILRKLGARNRAQAVALAMSQDLLVRAPGSD